MWMRKTGMVSFAYRCGALGGILLTDTESEADAALPGPELEDAPALLAAENGTVGNAVIYYAFDNGVNSNRYPYYSYMKDYWNGFGAGHPSGHDGDRLRPEADGRLRPCHPQCPRRVLYL